MLFGGFPFHAAWATGIDTFHGGYRTVEEIEAFLDQEANAYPGLAEKVDIGDSWCKTHPGACTLPAPYNGYDLWVMHITNRGIPGPKPVFWFEAGIHSREIATPEVAMRYISWLLDNYEPDAEAHWLVDYRDMWVMPVLNPDGHHIVEAGGGGNSPYYQRKNANNSNGCSTWPPIFEDHFGIDVSNGPHFRDVPAEHVFYQYVETAWHRGIISGYADGTFRPGNGVTRGMSVAGGCARSSCSPRRGPFTPPPLLLSPT